MIVDVHMHLTGKGWVRGTYLQFLRPLWLRMYNRTNGTNLTLEEYIAQIKKTAGNTTAPGGAYLLGIMDRVGIDHAIIFGVDWSIMTGEPKVTQQEQNKIHADVAKGNPKRFTAMSSLDPRRGNVMEMAKECIEDWGMKGFYLMQAAGFRYTDPICFPLYEKCIDWKVPLMLHCGTEIAHWDWGHPLEIANIVCKYPELTVILGHGGIGLWRDEVIMTASRPNCYIDMSAFQHFFEHHPDRFYEFLRDAIDECGADRIMWATGISASETTSTEEWLDAIRNPKTKIKFTKEEKDLITGKTAQAVWGIQGK